MTQQILISNLIYGLIMVLFVLGIYGMLEKEIF